MQAKLKPDLQAEPIALQSTTSYLGLKNNLVKKHGTAKKYGLRKGCKSLPFMAPKIFFGLTILLGSLAMLAGIISLAGLQFLNLLHLQFLADKGLARIFTGAGIGLIATAFVFFKANTFKQDQQ